MRVAALADVHGNAPALAAVLAEVEREAPDLVVFCGDLTWGSLPRETLALVRCARASRRRFVRGNADRALLELSRDEVEQSSLREQWMLAQHDPRTSRCSPASSRRCRSTSTGSARRASPTARRARTRSA